MIELRELEQRGRVEKENRQNIWIKTAETWQSEKRFKVETRVQQTVKKETKSAIFLNKKKWFI